MLSKHLKDTLRLNQEDIRYVPPKTIVDTNFLGPCFGVIIYDKEHQRAYAGHFPNPERGSLVLLVNKAIFGIGNPENLDVFCVGNSPMGSLEDVHNRYVQETNNERQFVVSTLEKYGFDKSKTIFRLTSRPEQYAKLKLDADSGKTEYTLFSNRSKKPLYKGSISKV